MKNKTSTSTRRISNQRILIIGLVGLLGLFLLVSALTKGTWRAIAYASVIMLGFLFVLAIYFWGSMVFGGLIEAWTRRERYASSWSIGRSSNMPQHDIDPGLELLAAGMLVYRMGEVHPHIHFRKVPLGNARAMRPFIVARTGSERPYQFHFALTDDRDVSRFSDTFTIRLGDAPQMVMPQCRLVPDMPRKVVGQRWTLQVRSGVTVVTSFRFMFIDSAERSDVPGGAIESAAQTRGRLPEVLPGLLDDALKRDVMISTEEIVLEGL